MYRHVEQAWGGGGGVFRHSVSWLCRACPLDSKRCLCTVDLRRTGTIYNIIRELDARHFTCPRFQVRFETFNRDKARRWIEPINIMLAPSQNRLLIHAVHYNSYGVFLTRIPPLSGRRQTCLGSTELERNYYIVIDVLVIGLRKSGISDMTFACICSQLGAYLCPYIAHWLTPTPKFLRPNYFFV